jgi:glycerate kinase
MSGKYILAIDSFKGCLSSAEAEQAAADGIMSVCGDAEIIRIPVTDGGEGMLDVFSEFMSGGKVYLNVHDPLLRRIRSAYFIADGDTALIETALSCGLCLLKEEERNPMRASTYGVGEVVYDAIERGCTNFMIGLGGSGTSDAGVGMMMALVDKYMGNTSYLDFLSTSSFSNMPCSDYEALYNSLLDRYGYILNELFKYGKRHLTFTLASDVVNPLYGPQGAACIFARQKGADANEVSALDERARIFSYCALRHIGKDCSQAMGAGAAGGLGYAFLEFLHANTKSGIDMLLDITGFDDMLNGCDGVVTGEGSADAQTLMGKVPFGILCRARKKQIPVYLMAGRVRDDEALKNAGFCRIMQVSPSSLPIEEAMKPQVAKTNIREAVRKIIREGLHSL